MANLKQIREILNLSQETLADKLGVSSRTVQNWESGKVIPKSKDAMIKALEKQAAQVRGNGDGDQIMDGLKISIDDPETVKKIVQMNDKACSLELQVKELNRTIESMQKTIEAKDETIAGQRDRIAELKERIQELKTR